MTSIVRKLIVFLAVLLISHPMTPLVGCVRDHSNVTELEQNDFPVEVPHELVDLFRELSCGGHNMSSGPSTGLAAVFCRRILIRQRICDLSRPFSKQQMIAYDACHAAILSEPYRQVFHDCSRQVFGRPLKIRFRRRWCTSSHAQGAMYKCVQSAAPSRLTNPLEADLFDTQQDQLFECHWNALGLN